MPIYPWLCANEECGGVTDSVQTFADIDVPPTKCDHCPSTEFKERLIIRPQNVKGYILLRGECGGFHDFEYSKYRSLR